MIRERRAVRARDRGPCWSLRRCRAFRVGIVALATACGVVVPAAAAYEGVWSAPETLSAAGAQAGWPAVAMSPDDRAVVVWVRESQAGGPDPGAPAVVEAATRRAWGAWARETVGPAPAGTPERLDVATNQRGEAVVVYDAAGHAASTPVAVSRRAAGGWSLPVALRGGADGLGSGPSVGMDADGDAVAVWSDPLPVGPVSGLTWGAVRAPTGDWSAPQGLSDPLYWGEYFTFTWGTDVAVSPRGTAVAVWTREVVAALSAETATWSRRSGRWTAGVMIPGTGDTAVQGVGVDARGNPVVGLSWADADHVDPAVAAGEGGAWSVDLLGEQLGGPLKVAVGPRGDAIVVWMDAVTQRLTATTRPPGGTWSVPEQLPASTVDQRSPTVAIDADGWAVAAWIGRTEGGDVVETTQRRAGEAWSRPRRLGSARAPEGVGGRSALDLAIGRRHAAVAVWLNDGMVQAATTGRLRRAAEAG